MKNMTIKRKAQGEKLSFFEGYICRGSKDYKMSEIEINFVRVEVFKQNLRYERK